MQTHCMCAWINQVYAWYYLLIFNPILHIADQPYAVYVLQELKKDIADNTGLKINILYDTACMLVKHLQVRILFFKNFVSLLFGIL